jgi:integrase
MSFIVQHGSTWHFRWRDAGGVTYKISLRTGNKRKAGLLASKLHSLVAREAKLGMDENRLRRALTLYRDALLNADDQKRWTDYEPWADVPRSHLPPNEPYDDILHDELTLAIKNKDFDFLSGLDGQFNELTGIDITDLPGPEANKVRYLAAKELCRVMEIQRLRKTGNHGLELLMLSAYSGGITGTSAPTMECKPSIALSAAIIAWEKVLRKEGKVKSTLTKYLACAREFLELTSDLDVIDITKTHCRNYREALQKLPAKYVQKFPGKTIAQLLRMEHKSDTLCAPRAVNDKLNCVKLFFAWAVDQGHLDVSPMTDIQPVKASKNNTGIYAPFTRTDLENMFGSDYLEHTKSDSWKFWIPLLALFTGARQSELAQLKVSDVTLIDGVWCIHIKTDEDLETRVKTEAGIRTVPVHQFIVEILHFPEFLESRHAAGKTMLFDIDRKLPSDYGKSVSQWFHKVFLPKIQLEASPRGTKKKFHSFRSTVCTCLKHARVPGRLAAQAIGHIPPNIAGDWIDGHSMTYDYYAGGYPIPDIYGEVTCKIDYKINLGHLATSPWTGACVVSSAARVKRKRKFKNLK